MVGISAGLKLRHHLAGFRQRLRIVSSNACAFSQEGSTDRQGRGLTDVVGIGFEGKAEHRQRLPFQPPDRVSNLLDHPSALNFVDPRGGRRDLHRIAVSLAGLNERREIFRKAGASETRPCVKKLRPDAMIKPHALRHHLDVGSDPLAQIRHLVDE